MKCPNCDETIDHLNVSKQIEGILELPEKPNQPLFALIQWGSLDEQHEPIIYTCPLCSVEIEDETLKKWGIIGSNKTEWEMWTLTEEDIRQVAEDFNLSLEGKDLSEIAEYFKEELNETIGDNWQEYLAKCIRQTGGTK